MRRIEVAELALAATLLLTGSACASNKDKSQDLTPVPAFNPAPRYVPADRLPIRRDKPFFIRYQGSPPLEHIEYLRQVCGDLGISVQGPEIVISTVETEDCFGKIQNQKPRS